MESPNILKSNLLCPDIWCISLALVKVYLLKLFTVTTPWIVSYNSDCGFRSLSVFLTTGTMIGYSKKINFNFIKHYSFLSSLQLLLISVSIACQLRKINVTQSRFLLFITTHNSFVYAHTYHPNLVFFFSKQAP